MRDGGEINWNWKSLETSELCGSSTHQHLQEQELLLKLMNPLILHLNNMVQTLQLLLPEWARAPIILEKVTKGPHQSAWRDMGPPCSPSSQELTALALCDFTAMLCLFLGSPSRGIL